MRALSSILALALLTGCATSYRPFTEREKQLYAFGAVGHCMDAVTTEVALNRGMEEGNPVVRKLIVDDGASFIAIKAGLMGATYLAAHCVDDPGYRSKILRANIIAGWTPALWNIGVLLTY